MSTTTVTFRACAFCKKDISHLRIDARFCSNSCRVKAAQSPIIVPERSALYDAMALQIEAQRLRLVKQADFIKQRISQIPVKEVGEIALCDMEERLMRRFEKLIDEKLAEFRKEYPGVREEENF